MGSRQEIIELITSVNQRVAPPGIQTLRNSNSVCIQLFMQAMGTVRQKKLGQNAPAMAL